MHIKRKILIIFISAIIFILGAIGIFVWIVNTLSQNEAVTTKIIRFQIDRLLDLDSKVEHPHAYLDWDLQYKIRANKLTFINNKEDLVSVEDIKLNVFVPYLLFRKIYITELDGSNLYMDFERWENNKINIVEIFNITGFFKIYFRNSAIKVDKYFFKFTDNYHKPSERMFITGDNIFINKFTLKKYFHVLMDGKIDYNKKTTPFSISYNAKIPTIKDNFNLEVDLPDFDTQIFKTYISEIDKNLKISGNGSLHFKISNRKFFNINTTLKDMKFDSPKIPYKFDFSDEFSLFSRFGYEKNNFTIDELNIEGKDFGTEISGKVFDITSHPLNIDLNIRVAENSNGNSILRILPRGVQALNYAIDKAKNHNVGAIVEGFTHAKGKIGYLNIDGQVKAKRTNLGYGFDLPNSTALLDFKGDKMFIDTIYYPNHNPNNFVTVKGDIKITKPIYLNLIANSSKELDAKSGQKALNIFSDIFNFTTGPLKDTIIDKGYTNVNNLSIKATPPKVLLNGNVRFWDCAGSYPGYYGAMNNISGNVNFAGKDINYQNIKGYQNGVAVYVKGNTDIHNDALTHVYIDVPSVPLPHAKLFIDNSPMMTKVSGALKSITNPIGNISVNMSLISNKYTKEPETQGTVKVKDGSCDLEGLAYRANQITGKVDFTNFQSDIDLDGMVHDTYTKLTGFARANYSDLYIYNPKADIQKVYEFITKSPMFGEMAHSFDDFSDFSGTLNVKTNLKGNFPKKELTFKSDIDIIDGKLKYKDIKEDINISGGHILATKDKIYINNINGNTFDAQYKLGGVISNVGTSAEKYDLTLKMTDLSIEKLSSILDSKIFTEDIKKLLNEYEFIDGTIDVTSFVEKNDAQAHIKFHDASICYKKSNKNILAKSGDFFFSKDSLKMKNIDVNMQNSNFLVSGEVKDYSSNPYFDINVSASVFEDDFNSTIAKIFNVPLTLTGEIFTNINFVGDLKNWHTKIRAMLDEKSLIFFKGANIGKGLSNFMFFDVERNNNDIQINNFDVYSNSFNMNARHPEVIGELKGKIKDINSDNPILQNLAVRINNYTDISFLNILFYDQNKQQPLLSNGYVKGNVVLNGSVDNIFVIGKADVIDAVIPSIDTTIKKMYINFNKDLISTKDTIINLAGSIATINAVLDNKITTPVNIREFELKSDLFNADDVIENFTKLFAQNTTEDKSNKNIVKKPEVPPITIESGKVDLEKFIYKGLLSDGLSANFNIASDWQCKINDIKANVTGGELTGDVIYNFKTTEITGDLEAKNVVANAFATTFLNLPNEIYGNMDANIKFSSKGELHEDLIKNFNGSAHFSLDKGRMLRLGSIEYMLRVANTVKGGLTRLNLNAIVNLVAPKTGYFDKIEGNLEIKNGVILTKRITSSSSELNLFLTGLYNMNNSNVNATIVGQMPKESKESIIWLGSLGRISLRSLIRQLSREGNNPDNDNPFLLNPESYLYEIPGLKDNNGNYRFFIVELKGNLYTDKYVDHFKWIK